MQLQQTGLYKISSQNRAKITVSDAIDRQIRQDLLTASSQAFLPDVLGSMVTRTSDNISQRIQHGISETENNALSLSGNTTIEELIEMSGEITNQGSVLWREVLNDSSFSMTLMSGDDFVTPITVWGIGDYRALNSNFSSNTNAWSGDVFTRQLGIDATINQEILTGFSASITENEIKIESNNDEGLDFNLNSTTLNPYFGWISPNQEAELRAITSFGIGEFRINQARYNIEVLTSKSYSLALAGNKELYSSESILNGTTKIKIIGDSWYASQLIDGKDVLANLQTNAHYLRIRTEGTHQFSSTRGTSLTPLISLGIRDDRRDQLTNFGMEITSGFHFADPIGVTIAGTGSMLYTGESNIQKMSINGSLGFDHGNDALGLTLEISPAWGQTQESVRNSIWSSGILANNDEVGQYTDGTQVNSEIGYGFTLGDDSRKLNLYSGYEFDTKSNSILSIGTSVSIGPNLSLDLERKQLINPQESEPTRYYLNGRLSW